MSMSQEEIEALMNGLDIEDDKTSFVEPTESIKVNTQEIEELLSQTEDYKKEDKKSNKIVEEKSEAFLKTDEIEQLLNEIESSEPIKDEKEEDDIKFSLEELDDLQSFNEVIEPIKEKNEVKVEKTIPEKKDSRSEDDIAKDWTSSKINEGVFPFPAEKDTKVVNQLSQVANDSEEKVSQIFDILSIALDNNNEVRANIKNLEAFVSSQTKLLESLNKKFPNINVFNEHLGGAKNISGALVGLKTLINDEDNQIFQAMELMQFNDINRQKIERVMSVIRKLSSYLNNLFEDDGTSSDVAIAKHIHGDTNDDLIGEDLDKLIEEFAKN